MKPLLPLTDPRYLRRLVRACNALPDGFYSGGQRYTRARFSAGRLQTRRVASYLDPHDPRNGRTVWVTVDPATLGDAYGRAVCASRTL